MGLIRRGLLAGTPCTAGLVRPCGAATTTEPLALSVVVLPATVPAVAGPPARGRFRRAEGVVA